MNKDVKLDEVINALELQDNDDKAFYSKLTGEIFIINEEEYNAAEENGDITSFPEWQREFIQGAIDVIENEENYIMLPSKYCIDEYNIMEEFCLSIDESNIRDDLYYSIKGSGAFKRFRDKIERYDIENDWYKYTDEALKQIAIEWCKEKNINYID